MTSLDEMRSPRQGPSAPAMLIYLMNGPILWGLHFMLVYCAHTLVCALGGSAALSVVVLATATFIAAIILLFTMLRQRWVGRHFGLPDEMSGRETYDSISRLLGLLSLFGVVWSGVAIAAISSCAPGR